MKIQIHSFGIGCWICWARLLLSIIKTVFVFLDLDYVCISEILNGYDNLSRECDCQVACRFEYFLSMNFNCVGNWSSYTYSEKATKFCEISTVYLTQYIGQIYGGDFIKFCGLLKIYELYQTYEYDMIMYSN